jgi:tryptophanyl-tRNA synthetase
MMLTTYNSLLSLSDIAQSYQNPQIFQNSNFNALEDPYKPAVEKVVRAEVKDSYKKYHEQVFKPAKTVPVKIYKASFEHMSDRVEVKKNYRDADGKVELEPKNFYTWNPKKGKVGKRCFFNG